MLVSSCYDEDRVREIKVRWTSINVVFNPQLTLFIAFHRIESHVAAQQI